MVWGLHDSAVDPALYPGYPYFLLAKAYYMVHIVTTYNPWKREASRYSVLKLTALGDFQNIKAVSLELCWTVLQELLIRICFLFWICYKILKITDFLFKVSWYSFIYRSLMLTNSYKQLHILPQNSGAWSNQL